MFVKFIKIQKPKKSRKIPSDLLARLKIVEVEKIPTAEYFERLAVEHLHSH